MARPTFTVGYLANEAGVDIDEALIVLWDGGIDYVDGPGSSIRRRDANRARGLVGLATRRELASKNAWRLLFELDEEGFKNLLETLDVSVSDSRRLPKKAINRLRAEANSRGLSWGGLTYSKNRAKVQNGSGGGPPFVWPVIGKEREIAYLTGDDARAIHQELVEDFATADDPIAPPGVRDENLLGSAISRPYTAIGETRKYPSVEMAAAALLHSMIHDHPFHNGNKRTALVSMLAFLDLNRLLVICSEDELFKTVIRIAQHSIVPPHYDRLADREVIWIAQWIDKYSRRIELGDRTIPFRRLRKLLTRYGCSYRQPKGNQIYIDRTILERGMLRKRRKRALATQTSYGDEGRDLPRTSVAKIRKDLHLDELHGIDSASFYDNAPAAAGEFIVKFRKTLRRLASL